MNVDEVIKEVIKVSRSMRSDHESVINVMESASGLLSNHAKYHILKVFRHEVRNYI